MSVDAMKQALDWFKCYRDKSMSRNNAEALAEEVEEALRAAIEQAEKQEPVAWIRDKGNGSLWWYQSVDENGDPNPDDVPLYTAPPQRQPLTEEDIAEIMDYGQYGGRVPEYAKNFVRAIERKHGIGDEK